VAENRNGDRYLRMLWVSRRGHFFKLTLWILALWGGYSLIASDHGLLHLRQLRREAVELDAVHAGLVQEQRQVQNEMAEDPNVSIERGLREKYRKSRPGEIVYRTKVLQAPVDSVGGPGSVGSFDGSGSFEGSGSYDGSGSGGQSDEPAAPSNDR